MAGLNNRSRGGIRSGGYTCSFLNETAEVNSVDTIIITLVDDLQHIARLNQGQGYLQTASSPAPRNRQVSTGKGHLVSRYSHRLEQFTPHLALGIFVNKAKIVEQFAPAFIHLGELIALLLSR